MKFKYLILALFIVACNKPIDITTPTIVLKSGDYFAFDTLTFKTIQSAEIDGEIVPPDYFDWSIFLSSNDSILLTQNGDSDELIWIPETAGIYRIEVKIGYDGNKSVTAVKDIQIDNSPASILHLLTGHWQGTGQTNWTLTWDLDMVIDADGHYNGTATNVQPWPWYMVDDFYNADGESYEEEKFYITSVNDFGISSGYVVTSYGIQALYDNCFNDLEFSNQNNTVTFSVYYNCDYTTWNEKFSLNRVP